MHQMQLNEHRQQRRLCLPLNLELPLHRNRVLLLHRNLEPQSQAVQNRQRTNRMENFYRLYTLLLLLLQRLPWQQDLP
jgi:hypothetical protein